MAEAHHQQEERRKGYVEVEPELLKRVEDHLASFEARRNACRETLAAGKQRMDKIELELGKLTALLNTADGFIKATRIIAAVVGVLLATLVSLVIWIATEKNADIRTVQETLQEHSLQIKRTLDVVERMAAAQERDSQRLERHLDAIGGNGSAQRREGQGLQ